MLEKGLGWCGVIWVREKELRLDIHLFLRSPIREPHLCPCDVRSEKKIQFFLLSFKLPTVTTWNTPSWFCRIRLGTDLWVLQFCNQLFCCCGDVWLWRETRYSVQATGTLANKRSPSHTLESEPRPAGTDPYGNYVISWPLLFQNTYNSGSFLPDLKSPEGKLEHGPFPPWVKMFKATLRENQRWPVTNPSLSLDQILLIAGMLLCRPQATSSIITGKKI